MVFVAVNKDGTEVVGSLLERAKGKGFWEEVIIFSDDTVSLETPPALPQGTIKRLIGRDLSWEDGPIQLKAR